MGTFLLRLFLSNKPNNNATREQFGAFAGAVGLGCNVVLFAVKIAAGLLAGSIAMVADAVNNLSDAASSVVTLAGFRMSQKPADKEHPFGHARIEYMTGAFVAIVIILVGFELLRSSVRKIIQPSPVAFSAWSFVALGASVLIKGWMQSFYRMVAGRIQSPALLVAAKDSRNDVIATLVVLAGAAAQFLFGIQADGWLGAAVAVFIMISGFLSMKDTLSPLLGEAPATDTVKEICRRILQHDGVLGLHDLMVHSYGPGKLFATVHIEIPAHTDPREGHGIIDHIEREVERDMGITLVGHYDPIDPPNEETTRIANDVERVVRSVDASLTIHDLRIAKTHDHIKIIFDVGVPPSYKGKTADLKHWIAAGVSALDAAYYPVVHIDRNYTVPE